jgi:hypothetical protein
MRSRTALLTTTFGLLLALPGLGAAPPVQDLCFGNGTPGPFALSWKHITPGTESVTVNGLPQLRGLDYTLDADNGAITFTRDLPARSAAAVTYEPDPVQAQRNDSGRTIPLSVDLLRGQHGYFSFNALGKQGADTSGDVTLGVGMGWQGAHNAQLSSHFFYTPVTAALSDKGSDADSLAKRTGLSLAGSATAADWALFSFGFSRAGVSLQNAGDDSLRAGQQLFALSSRLTPTKMVQAQVNFRQSSPTDAPKDNSGAGAVKDTSLALTVTPSDKTQIGANLAQSGTGASGMTQTLGLSVEAHPTTGMEVSASYDGKNAPGTAGDSRTLSLKTVLTPAKTVSVETSATQSQLGTATTNQQAVQLSLAPRAAVQIGAGLALRQKGTDGSPDTLDTAIASVNGTLRPLSFLEFSGSYKSRMAPAKDTATQDLFDTSAAKVALSPFKSVRLVGTYAQNPDDGGDTLQRLARKGVGLETTFGALGLSGGYDWSRRLDAADTEEAIHADLGLRFSPATQLTVGFQTRQNALDPSASRSVAYTVGFTHSLGDRFSLSLNGKRSQTSAAPSDYNASANLGMKF